MFVPAQAVVLIHVHTAKKKKFKISWVNKVETIIISSMVKSQVDLILVAEENHIKNKNMNYLNDKRSHKYCYFLA